MDRFYGPSMNTTKLTRSLRSPSWNAGEIWCPHVVTEGFSCIMLLYLFVTRPRQVFLQVCRFTWYD